MGATVLLTDIVEALEMQFDELPCFLDVDIGKLVTVSRSTLQKVEANEGEEPDLPDWQGDEWETAKQIASGDRFERLPDQYDVHEWDIMEEFAESVESTGIREELLNALHGKGAFRHFKDTVRRHRIEKDWFAFRTEALRQIAVEWCEERKIPWR